MRARALLLITLVAAVPIVPIGAQQPNPFHGAGHLGAMSPGAAW